MSKFLLAASTAIVALALASPANAVPVIQFAQTSNANTVTATENGGNTATTIAASNVVVNVSQNLGGLLGLEFFNLNATSIDNAVPAGTGALQHYAGSFSITSQINGGGINLLSGTFSDAALGVGSSLTMAIGSPPDLLSLTSSLIPAAELVNPTAVAFSLTNVLPPIAIIGNSLQSFTATVSGNASASPLAVPEPTSLALMGVGLLGLTLLRRRKA